MATACPTPLLFRNLETEEYRVAPCRRWICPSCRWLKAAEWRERLKWASMAAEPPNLFLTLTLTLKEPLPLWRSAPLDQQEPMREAARALVGFLTRALTRLVAEIRQVYGPFEYVAFVELTTGRRTAGHRPHLHLMARGEAVPKRWLSRRWEFHTKGSFMVDIQALRDPWLAAQYLVGYTVGREKKAQQEHLAEWPGPRVRCSRGYFPPAEQVELPTATGGEWELVGPLAWYWETRNPVSQATPSDLAALAGTGRAPEMYRKGAQDGSAKARGEDRPGQGGPGSGVLTLVVVTQIAGCPARSVFTRT